MELTAACQAFRGTLGAEVVVCKPADPEAKGLVERAHDYLERSFLPGWSFTGPAVCHAALLAPSMITRICSPVRRTDSHANRVTLHVGCGSVEGGP
jgi:hypothetical protein